MHIVAQKNMLNIKINFKILKMFRLQKQLQICKICPVWGRNMPVCNSIKEREREDRISTVANWHISYRP